MQIPPHPGMAFLAVLLGAALTLTACAPSGEVTPNGAPLPSATVRASPTANATIIPAVPSPVATAPVATPVPTATATIAPTNTAIPAVPTTPIPATLATPPPTAIPAPSATAPPLTATAVAPTPIPVSPTPLSGTSATDAQGRCALALPPGFAATGAGIFSGANGRALITLTALAVGANDTLDDVALPFVSAFTAPIGDYRQTAVARGADDLRLDFTGRTTAPGRGTIFLRQFGGTVCALSFFVAQGTEITYDQTVNALLASLRPTGAVG